MALKSERLVKLWEARLYKSRSYENLIILHFFVASRPLLYDGMPAHFADSPEMEAVYKMLSVTQPPPAPEVIAKQYRPASVVDKAHINGR